MVVMSISALVHRSQNIVLLYFSTKFTTIHMCFIYRFMSKNDFYILR
jgi:hypothetical protein